VTPSPSRKSACPTIARQSRVVPYWPLALIAAVSIDKLGFADRLHLSGAFGTIHRAAFDEDGFGDLVTAVHVSK
jgi:hypothetical protein